MAKNQHQANKPAPIKKGRKKKTPLEVREAMAAKALSIKSTIESGNLRKLKDIEHLFSKAMADEIGVNHGRFIDKLKNPIKFSVKELFKFAYFINTEPDNLLGLVIQEIKTNKEITQKLQKGK